jgi:LacI family transcriptional regulator
MGHRAIRMLIALINGDEVGPTHVTLDTGLVVRHSTRALS